MHAALKHKQDRDRLYAQEDARDTTPEQDLAIDMLVVAADDLRESTGVDFHSAVNFMFSHPPNAFFELVCAGLHIDSDRMRARAIDVLLERVNFFLPLDISSESRVLRFIGYLLAAHVESEALNCRKSLAGRCRWQQKAEDAEGALAREKMLRRRALRYVRAEAEKEDAPPAVQELLAKVSHIWRLKPTVYRIECPICEKEFEAARPGYRWCSNVCRAEARRQRQRRDRAKKREEGDTHVL
jgi:hypothetical protein